MIRTATVDDAPALSGLIRILGYELDREGVVASLNVYETEGNRVFLATEDEQTLGFLSFHRIPLFHQRGNLGRITAMAIDPAHHRRGIGRALVAAAEDFAMDRGCNRVEVTSGDHRSEDAHLFYQSLGYTFDCRRFLKRLP